MVALLFGVSFASLCANINFGFAWGGTMGREEYNSHN